MNIPTPADPVMEMARKCAADLPGMNALQKCAFIDGHWDDAPAVQSALAAIRATTEAAAALASAYANACRPHVTIGDDDSIYLTDHEEGEKRAASVIRDNLRANHHIKGSDR